MNKTLLHCLYEEWQANGGHFASPDTDLWFQQAFCEFGESTGDGLKRLLLEHEKAASVTRRPLD